MADDQEKTEDYYYLNEKRTSPFFYANRYDTKEKYFIFLYLLLGYLYGR
ncbi:MAG: hypothetical protein JJW00_08840 [Sulfurimonas sp.]|nr:hypothetical protein [Sulfurimonas sp.]